VPDLGDGRPLLAGLPDDVEDLILGRSECPFRHAAAIRVDVVTTYVVGECSFDDTCRQEEDWSEVGGRRSEVRGRKSEVRG
jgi:hypothetical protein